MLCLHLYHSARNIKQYIVSPAKTNHIIVTEVMQYNFLPLSPPPVFLTIVSKHVEEARYSTWLEEFI